MLAEDNSYVLINGTINGVYFGSVLVGNFNQTCSTAAYLSYLINLAKWCNSCFSEYCYNATLVSNDDIDRYRGEFPFSFLSDNGICFNRSSPASPIFPVHVLGTSNAFLSAVIEHLNNSKGKDEPPTCFFMENCKSRISPRRANPLFFLLVIVVVVALIFHSVKKDVDGSNNRFDC